MTMNTTPTEEKETTQITPSPKLGIVKGIVIILLGIIWLGNYSLGSMVLAQDHNDITWLVSVWPGLVIFVLCLWRGIVAICKRKVKRVTSIGFGFLTFLFIASLSYVLWILLPVVKFTFG